VSTRQRKVIRWVDGTKQTITDQLAVEEPLEIRVDTRPFIVTMRTPGHDHELAAGILFTEGVVQSREQIRDIRQNRRNRDGNSIDVFLATDVTVPFERLARRGAVTSSCGVCGKESIRAVKQRWPIIRSRAVVEANLLLQLPDRLRAAQPTFERTGGLHAAGIFTLAGELIVAREDIGRHNAVDKVIGAGLLSGSLPFDEHVLVVSGRTSFEILQKSLAARLPIVCAVSAPSSLAVEFAQESGQTLVGFVRKDRMNVYTKAQRVRFKKR
jgi:FdhD protein